MASWRLCVRLFFQSVDDTSNAVLDESGVEVDQQAKSFVGQPQVGEQLLSVNRCEDLNRLDLDDHLILDDQVGPEPDVNPNRSIDHRDWLLSDRPESTLGKFIGEYRMINRFQQSWPQGGVRKAASTISLAMAFSVMAAFYSLSPRRQDAKNATPARA